MADGVPNLVIVSDTHAGCQLGLFPIGGFRLDGGVPVMPSMLQQKLWGMWTEFFGTWVPEVTEGEPWDLVVDGDAIDGNHHNSVTQITHDLTDQRKIAYELLAPVVEACRKSGGRYWHIRGTEAHAGKSGQDEEQLAQQLGAVPSTEGNYARWELWKKVGSGLVHITHHIGTTSSSAHETSAINAELAAAFTDAGRWGDKPPDIIVRSHRHRAAEVRLPRKDGYATAFVTPAWQAKTPFTFRNMHGRTSEPQFGGSLVRQGHRDLYTRHQVWRPGRPEAE